MATDDQIDLIPYTLAEDLKCVADSIRKKKTAAAKRKIYSQADETPAFLEFWTLWKPHARVNDGRADARDGFMKAWERGASPADIVAGARYYLRALSDSEKKFVPLAKTWINRGAYEDLAVQEAAYQDRLKASSVTSITRPAEVVTPPKPMSPEEQARRAELAAKARMLVRGALQ